MFYFPSKKKTKTALTSRTRESAVGFCIILWPAITFIHHEEEQPAYQS